jgi:hypothetical protein
MCLSRHCLTLIGMDSIASTSHCLTIAIILSFTVYYKSVSQSLFAPQARSVDFVLIVCNRQLPDVFL